MNNEIPNPYRQTYVKLGQMTDVQQMPCCSSRNSNERSSWDTMLANSLKGVPMQLAPPSVIQQWWEPPRRGNEGRSSCR